jgi:hypothetical protein
MTYLIIGIVLIFVIFSGASLPKIDLSNVMNFFGGGGNGLVDVDKKINFALTNEYAGSALASKTLYVYDSDATLLETLTTGSDGTISTAFAYPSGTVLYVKYVNTNDKQWFNVVVPQMNPSDAQASSTNSVPLKSFAIGTYATDSLMWGATAINDAGEYNFTTNGAQNSFTYTVTNTGSDNTGIKDSYDPVYSQQWNVVFYITFSGSGYEKVIVQGFGSEFTLGSTHYVSTTLDPYALSKVKQGNVYKSLGKTSFVYTLDGTGYTGSSAIMQLEVYAYADAGYAQAHGGSFGASAFELCEQTVTLKA